MANESKTIANNVRQQRKARGLTQKALAALAGVDQPRIAELEAGESDPRVSTVGRVAEALGISTAALLIPPENQLAETG